MPESPNILNYTVGKGIASWKEEGESTFRDLGNVTQFEFTPTVEKLDHFSSRGGVREKDRSVVVSVSGSIVVTMEEFTVKNFALALLGTEDTDSNGRGVVEILAAVTKRGALKFVGTNDIGQRYDWLFPAVEFSPSSGISPLSDEWGNMEITGEVTKKDGSFGTLTHMGGEGEDDSESS
jgi:hypothetical protein